MHVLRKLALQFEVHDYFVQVIVCGKMKFLEFSSKPTEEKDIDPVQKIQSCVNLDQHLLFIFRAKCVPC